MLGTKEQRTEGMKRQAQELIEQAYDRGFKAGYEEGFKNGFDEGVLHPDINIIEKWIEQGRNEAWEAARVLYQFKHKNNKQLCEELFDYGFNEMICNISASEAIEKLKAWEQKQQEDELRVGDEVYLIDSRYPSIITCIFEEQGCEKAVCMTKIGKWSVNALKALHKTGKHYDEIAQVLAKMKEGAGE